MKTRLLVILLLTLTWVGLTGELKLTNFFEGFVLGVFISITAKHKFQAKSVIAKTPKTARFVLFVLYEVLRANFKVAYDIVTPKHHMKPGIVAYPLTANTDIEITLLAHIVTLTPGTLAIDISSDRNTMFIHAMYIDDIKEFIAEIKNNFENPLLEILR